MKLKRFFIASFLIAAFATAVSAQNYKTSVGLLVDFGDGTMVGPQVKHFFTDQIAGQGMVLFGSGFTALGVEGSYNLSIPGVEGLAWNVGVGPQVWLSGDFSLFVLRPSAGLEFTIPNVPLNVGFDWRPAWMFFEGSYFHAGQFGFSLRYVIK